jgi:hypothetical protein
MHSNKEVSLPLLYPKGFSIVVTVDLKLPLPEVFLAAANNFFLQWKVFLNHCLLLQGMYLQLLLMLNWKSLLLILLLQPALASTDEAKSSPSTNCSINKLVQSLFMLRGASKRIKS